MTVKEAKDAAWCNQIIERIDDPNCWGTASCMDDDETGIYYKPKGVGFVCLFALLSEMRLPKTS